MSTPNSPLRALETISDEIFDMWDKGMKSGKLLTALAGRISNYRPDVTAVRAALAADAHEANHALIKDLVEALKPLAAKAAAYDPVEGDDDYEAWETLLLIGDLRRARAAVARAEAAR